MQELSQMMQGLSQMMQGLSQMMQEMSSITYTVKELLYIGSIFGTCFKECGFDLLSVCFSFLKRDLCGIKKATITHCALIVVLNTHLSLLLHVTLVPHKCKNYAKRGQFLQLTDPMFHVLE